MSMLEKSERACLFCNSTDMEVIFSYDKPDKYEVAVGVVQERYFRSWVKCTNCNFHYSIYSRDSKILDSKILDSIYLTEYRSGESDWRNSSVEDVFYYVKDLPKKESETSYRVEWIKNHIDQAWNGNWVKKTNTKLHRLLDVGGATGIFAYEFQDSNWKSHVIDPDENGKFIQDKLNIPFFQKMYNPNFTDIKFNLISLVFVLEHVMDPVALLRNLRCNLEKNSFLYVEVPDEAAFQLKSPKDDIFNSCHLWMFGPQTLLPMLDGCGYEVLSMNRTQTRRGHYSLMVLAGKK